MLYHAAEMVFSSFELSNVMPWYHFFPRPDHVFKLFKSTVLSDEAMACKVDAMNINWERRQQLSSAAASGNQSASSELFGRFRAICKQAKWSSDTCSRTESLPAYHQVYLLIGPASLLTCLGVTKQNVHWVDGIRLDFSEFLFMPSFFFSVLFGKLSPKLTVSS